MKNIHLQLRNLIGQIESAMIQVKVLSPINTSDQLQPCMGGGGGGGGGGSMDTIKHTIGKLLKRAFMWYQNEAYRM